MNKRKQLLHQKWAQQIVFTGPAFLFFFVIIVIPFLLSIYFSLTSWNGVTSEIKWAGVANFKQLLLNDDSFRNSFWFTAKYTVVAVVLTNVVGFLLALLVTQPLKLSHALRTVFFLPNVIGGLLLGYIWSFIFVKGFETVGLLTNIPLFLLPWLGTAETAFWGMVIVSVWQLSGYIMVIYIASLMNIPKEQVEAAKIDGANRWQMLKSIIIPLVMPAVTVCLFLTISWSFKVFDVNLSLTKGGPFGSTESVALNIYSEAFRNNRYGLGTAKALVFFVIVALITMLQVYFTKKKEVDM